MSSSGRAKGQSSRRQREPMQPRTNTTDDVEQPTNRMDAAEASDVPAANPAEQMQTELQQAKQEASENYDRYLRVHADMENYKKRIERTYADLARNNKKELLLKLLGVKDNLERALAYGSTASQDGDESIVQGVRLTEYQLDQVLRNEGVTPIELKDQPYDPQLAEALGTVVDPGLPDHSVAQVVQQGYLYQDSVLRPAQVIVSLTDSEQEL